jgi:tRNA (cytidine/uridine-2'-O-)-methyltransferase
MRVVLVEPLQPGNTGNIGRLCVAAGAELTLVGRLGFSLSEKAVRRAGVDHWKDVRLSLAATLPEALAGVARDSVFLFDSAGAAGDLWSARFPDRPVLVFGNENPGLPPDLMAEWSDRVFRIPMPGYRDDAGDAGPTARSLNLSNAVAVVVYEALRQRTERERRP